MTKFEKLVLFALDIIIRSQTTPSWNGERARVDDLKKLTEDAKDWHAHMWVAIAERDDDKSPTT